MSNALLIQLFEHKTWCNRGLLDALRAIDPSGVDRVQWATILLTFDHTGRVDRLFRARLAGEPEPFDSTVAARPPALDDMAAAMADTWYIAYAARVTQAQLDEAVRFTFTDGDAGRMTRAEMLAHVITHGASHRGAVGKMLETLRLAGASDMVTTFVRTSRATA
jgi:uncharacterized damage-inducible protein DinB